jgi:hypothetical protein
MLAVAAVLALVSWRWGTPLALLAAAGLIMGTVIVIRLTGPNSVKTRGQVQTVLTTRTCWSAGACAWGMPLCAACAVNGPGRGLHQRTQGHPA